MKLAMILDSESGAPVLRRRVSDVSEGALWLLFRQTLPFLAPAPRPACCPPSPTFSPAAQPLHAAATLLRSEFLSEFREN